MHKRHAIVHETGQAAAKQIAAASAAYMSLESRPLSAPSRSSQSRCRPLKCQNILVGCPGWLGQEAVCLTTAIQRSKALIERGQASQPTDAHQSVGCSKMKDELTGVIVGGVRGRRLQSSSAHVPHSICVALVPERATVRRAIGYRHAVLGRSGLRLLPTRCREDRDTAPRPRLRGAA